MSREAPVEPKNLLFIMSDQHNRSVTGCYGNAVAQTPNLDSLAKNGVLFQNGYCNVPICVPSRASFATGRYAHTIGSWDNAKPYIGHEAASWGHRLTEQGHSVTTVGKLHYRSEDDPTGFPDQRVPMYVKDGIGDLYGLLRSDMPARTSMLQTVLDAGPGESEYIQYDRSIAEISAAWLKNEAKGHDKPWALFVSFVTPHFPLIVPQEYFDLYPLDSLPMPVQGAPDDWPDHPVIDFHRRVSSFERPLDERTIRNALAAYYGLVSFLDSQVGRVLDALHTTGIDGDTRVIYVSDHGEMLGNRGIWGRCSLYEESIGVPVIVSGDDLPDDRVVGTNVSLVDCFPTIVEAVGAQLQPQDDDLPGDSLWRLAREGDQPRSVFAEFHAVNSPCGYSMLRTERYKYAHYVGYPPQLFDMQEDPLELRNLAEDPSYAGVLTDLERELRTILDPEEVDRLAKSDQEFRLEQAGGREKVLAEGPKIPYTPAPAEFDPEQGTSDE
jgi:choline-sulfatase